jgi:uncharacterized membrane protein
VLDCRVKWRDRLWHWAFEIGIWFKGIDGTLEMFGGILFLVASPHAVNHFVVMLTQDELDGDSDDWIFYALRNAAHHLSGLGKLIAGAFLIGHGGVKFFLAIGILRGKLWCYPTAIIVLGTFILLQIGRMGFHFSWLMLFLTFIDIVIILLIWHEYRYVKRRQELK